MLQDSSEPFLPARDHWNCRQEEGQTQAGGQADVLSDLIFSIIFSNTIITVIITNGMDIFIIFPTISTRCLGDWRESQTEREREG